MGLKFYTSFMRHTSKVKIFSLRKAVVQEALEKGIKCYSMSKNTVRLWLSDGFKRKGMMGC